MMGTQIFGRSRSASTGASRSSSCDLKRMLLKWALRDADKLFQFRVSLIIGHLTRRVLAKGGGGSVDRSAQVSIHRQPCATDEVDRDACAIWRVLDRQA